MKMVYTSLFSYIAYYHLIIFKIEIYLNDIYFPLHFFSILRPLFRAFRLCSFSLPSLPLLFRVFENTLITFSPIRSSPPGSTVTIFYYISIIKGHKTHQLGISISRLSQAIIDIFHLHV